MLVFARNSLAPPTLPADRDVLLLEGSWQGTSADERRRQSLDEVIIPTRFDGLDATASELVEQIIDAGAHCFTDQNLFDLGSLKLRYAAVKWLRPIVYLESLEAGRMPNSVDLFLEEHRDGEYAALWRAMADRFGFQLRTRITPSLRTPQPAVGGRLRAFARRVVGRALATHATIRSAANFPSRRGPHVVLCGNPRILKPVCDALLSQGARVSWLVDRFPVRQGWAHRKDSVGWIVCDRTKSQDYRMPLELPALSYSGVALSRVIEVWLAAQSESQIADVAQCAPRMREQLQCDPPSHVVVDEDATPLKRLVLRESRMFGASTQVVQHGVCGVRFGFTPLLADRIFAWDGGSRLQLESWGVGSERISIVGSIAQEALACEVQRLRAVRVSDGVKRVLLLMTTPPRDDRPDAVEFHLTTASHMAMIRFVVEEVARLKGVELIVKRHPRATTDEVLNTALQGVPSLSAKIVSHGSLAQWIAASDCVLSCGSSAGLEAAAAGSPVVQVLPPGSGNIVPADWYGMLGTARSAAELRTLLSDALSRDFHTEEISDDHRTKCSPAQRIAAQLLASKLPHPVRPRPALLPLSAGAR